MIYKSLSMFSIEKLKFYGRRKTKPLSPFRQKLMDFVLPQLTIPIKKKINIDTIFSFKPKETWLEIGFGGGEHLAAQVQKNPEVGFIGSEVFINGIANFIVLLKEAEWKKRNIRIYPDDVRKLFPCIPDESIERIYLLYPDPWPKKKHQKRRMISKDILDVFMRILKKNGQLFLATDRQDYLVWSLMQIAQHKGFKLQTKEDDFHKPFLAWVPTKYEEKAKKENRRSFYLLFKKS